MKKVQNIAVTIVHLVVGVALMVLAQLAGQAVAKLLFSGKIVPMYIVYSAVYVALTLLVVPLYAKLTEHLSYADLGMVNMLPGPLWLVLGLALPLGVTAFYLLFVDGSFIHASAEIASVLASVTLTSAMAGPTEEVIFRGMLMHSVQKRWGTVAGVLAPSILFAAIHVIMMPTVTVISYVMLLVSGTLVGVMFSVIALRTGSVWASSIVHSLWNVIIIGGLLSIHAPGAGVTEMALYEYELVSDNLFLTGGNYGIECSLPAMIGFVIVSVLTLALVKNPPAPARKK